MSSQRAPPLLCVRGPPIISELIPELALMDSHRTAHMAGQNYSQLIRQAVLFDFIKKNVDDGPPPEDMWRDWSDELKQAGTAFGSSAKL